MSPEETEKPGINDKGRLGDEETVGEILLASREKTGRTLDDLSQETKIPKRTLNYIETDNFEAIPAKVYARGFLRAYAEALELDVEYILNKYEVQTGQTHKSKGDLWEIEAEIVEEKVGSPGILRRFLLPALIIIVITVFLISIGRRGRRVEMEPPHVPEIVEELLEQEREEETIPPAVQTPAKAEPMELQLIASLADSIWFELVTISAVEETPETTAYNFLLLPGRKRYFQATEAFILRKVGNAGGFVAELNGKMLPPLGRKGRVLSDIKITRAEIPAD